MRSPKIYIASTLTLSLSLLLLSGGSTAKTKASQEGNPKGTVLFVVSSQQVLGAYVVPFVIIEQGQFNPPVAGDSDANELNSFAKSYYAKGSKYRVLFGGGEAGSLTIKKSNKDSECGKSSADVTLQSRARLNKNVMALA